MVFAHSCYQALWHLLFLPRAALAQVLGTFTNTFQLFPLLSSVIIIIPVFPEWWSSKRNTKELIECVLVTSFTQLALQLS